MDLLADLEARGLIHDSTDREALRARIAEGPVGIYYGCDPTADSLHVGNLIGLIMLRRFRDAGHRAIALAGGATGMVGDPGGRSAERNMLDQDTLDRNVAAIKAQIAAIVGTGDDSAVLVDNRDWTHGITLLEFLRDVGKHVTVNQMMARESVKMRLASENGISFTEFSYMLLQANDYLWLFDHLGCEIQIGGSDQWGNIISGVDLIRRVRSAQVHAFSWPLLTAADGSKLGKTTGARAWLSAERTSPYQFRQHWIQLDDAVVGAQLMMFSLRPVADIEALMAEHAAAPERRLAQRALADEMTELIHGPDAARTAAAAAEVLFGADPATAAPEVLVALEREIPTVTVDGAPGETRVHELLVRAGLASSNSEVSRLITQRGIRVGARVVDGEGLIEASDLLSGSVVLVRKGKRDYLLGKFVPRG